MAPNLIARAAEQRAGQAARGRDPNLAFLHIPKTGGTSVEAVFRAIAAAGGRPPVRYRHNIDLAAVDAAARAAAAPPPRVIVILRDPAERLVSGFASRLRQGRPTRERIWTPAEATVFAHYRNVERFLRSLVSDDPFEVSMARFAFDAVPHLKHGYRYYFGGPDRVRAAADRFAVVGEMPDLAPFFRGLGRLCGAEAAALDAAANPLHVAPAGEANPMATLSDADRAALQERLAGDYAVFNTLRRLGTGPRPA